MVRIIDIIGSPVAISPFKANALFEHFVSALQHNTCVEYSFQGIEDCSSAFCNAAIGKLYMKYDAKLVSSLISFTDFDAEGIWEEKVKKATRLGVEENYRNNNQKSLEAVLA